MVTQEGHRFTRIGKEIGRTKKVLSGTAIVVKHDLHRVLGDSETFPGDEVSSLSIGALQTRMGVVQQLSCRFGCDGGLINIIDRYIREENVA